MYTSHNAFPHAQYVHTDLTPHSQIEGMQFLYSVLERIHHGIRKPSALGK